MDKRLALLAGTDIPIPECRLILHQPNMKEIAMIGESNFFMATQTLCLNKTMFIEDKDVLNETNNFQIFMMVMLDQTTADKREAVEQLLNIMLSGQKVLFTPNSLMVSTKDGEMNTIDKDNFDYLQDVLREIFCANTGPMDQQAFNPANEKAKEIADKLMRGRQKVAEIKGNSNVSIFSQYLSILSVGIHIPLTELLKLTMFQIYDLMERYSLYLNWDIDIRSRLAGGKPQDQPENWMKNIHEK